MAQPTSGDLRTPVYFYGQLPSDDGEPGDMPDTQVFMAFAQVYGASTKDTAILNSHEYSAGVTIKIRDTRGEFVPDPSKNTVVIDDYRYASVADWDILDVRPDFEDDAFTVVVLGNPKTKAGATDGR